MKSTHFPTLLVLGMILFPQGTTYAESHITDPNLDFSFDVPLGFVDSPEIKSATNAIYAFKEPMMNNGKMPAFLLIKRLGGTLRPEPPVGVKDADGNPVHTYSECWNNTDVYVAVVPEVVQGVNCINLNVLIPLKKEALQIMVGGEASRQSDLQKIQQTFLSHLEGQCSFLTDYERSRQCGKASVFIVILVGAIVYIIYRRVHK